MYRGAEEAKGIRLLVPSSWVFIGQKADAVFTVVTLNAWACLVFSFLLLKQLVYWFAAEV